jgi:predicted dehydrogenase
VIRWLVAGAGQAGRCHIAAIDKTDGAVLAGIVDPGIIADASVPVYADLLAALTDAEADAIVIAAPNDTQAGLVQMALDSGLPVLCEKPVGKTYVEAEALNAQANELDVPLGVVLNQRAQIHSRWIQELIESGALLPRTVTFTGDLAKLQGWHADPARSGGGVLRTIGLHYIDLLLWWFGPPSDVQASLTGAHQEDCIDVALGFSSGCRAQIKLDAVKERATGPVRCVIEGDGTTVELIGHSITAVEGLPEPPQPEPLDTDLFFGPGHLTVIAEATAALENGRRFPLPVTEVFPALAVVDEIYNKERR